MSTQELFNQLAEEGAALQKDYPYQLGKLNEKVKRRNAEAAILAAEQELDRKKDRLLGIQRDILIWQILHELCMDTVGRRKVFKDFFDRIELWEF
jgi:hypothetical protein